MEKGITCSFGNAFGEFCCNAIYKGQITCDHDGCNAKVHRWCQWAWLCNAGLPCDVLSPYYCPTHKRQWGDYIRRYYEDRHRPIPETLHLTTSEDVTLPLLNSDTSPELNIVAQNFDGEGNQGTLNSTAENTTGTFTNKERSYYETQNEDCFFGLRTIDVNDRESSVRSSCNHLFIGIVF